jgi:IS30 family transposase
VAVKSTTLDNGRETHDHYKLRSKFNMDTYHAHPYSSYERGTNEHGNWHLRYYFPKGTDFKIVTSTELSAVVREINNRPREILGFKTANEMYNQLLEKALGVRSELE